MSSDQGNDVSLNHNGTPCLQVITDKITEEMIIGQLYILKSNQF